MFGREELRRLEHWIVLHKVFPSPRVILLDRIPVSWVEFENSWYRPVPGLRSIPALLDKYSDVQGPYCLNTEQCTVFPPAAQTRGPTYRHGVRENPYFCSAALDIRRRQGSRVLVNQPLLLFNFISPAQHLDP